MTSRHHHHPDVSSFSRSILPARASGLGVALANAVGAPGARLESVQDLARWRDALRARLRAERAALPALARAGLAAAILPRLDQLVARALPDGVQGRRIFAYRPINGEIDLTDWMSALAEAGAIVAVPRTRSHQMPFGFRRWRPEDEAAEAAQNCPSMVPDSDEIIMPDVVVVPMLGWDAAGYRLGYGSGYFDRTLARLAPSVRRIGVALQQAHVQTLNPQPFDIRMHHIVTQTATHDFPV